MVRYKDENGEIIVVENATIVDENGNEIETQGQGNDNLISISVIADELKSAQEIISRLVQENETISKTLEELKKAYTNEFFNNSKEDEKEKETETETETVATMSEVANMF